MPQRDKDIVFFVVCSQKQGAWCRDCASQANGNQVMPTMDERTIKAIEGMWLTHLEAQVVEIIAGRKGLDANAALGLWYGIDPCRSVELNEFGLQYLDANYLVDELMDREEWQDRA
ncbi:MAG: hypothetical protein Q4A07_10820 [Coriobacteriales bacterium]|nr:hypothetical protein [Coriobacteriales bacterium]